MPHKDLAVRAEYRRAHYQRNKEAIKAASNLHYATHAERIRAERMLKRNKEVRAKHAAIQMIRYRETEEFAHMKERPILFTPENAQKVFDGSKCQTRRIIKPQPKVVQDPMWGGGGYVEISNDKLSLSLCKKRPNDKDLTSACPYGVPGDRLWLREAWCHAGDSSVMYRGEQQDAVAYKALKWKPAIHMPRWACRTVLEITEIRVQRVQEISEEDAIAEGCRCGSQSEGMFSARHSFIHLWKSINGPGSWDANPWVWAITFKKVA